MILPGCISSLLSVVCVLNLDRSFVMFYQIIIMLNIMRKLSYIQKSKNLTVGNFLQLALKVNGSSRVVLVINGTDRKSVV